MNPLRRHATLLARYCFGGLFGILTLQAALALLQGEPDYFNFFRQPVSSLVALVVGLGGLLLSIFWPSGRDVRSKRWRRSKGSVIQRTDEGLPGRNDPCHCGSGRKYKKCCLRSDEEALREARLSRQSAQLNRSHGVTSGAGMADRGLRGR